MQIAGAQTQVRLIGIVRQRLLKKAAQAGARILMAANAVVANNPNRKAKTLFTANAEGEKIASYLASDERDEARFIAGEIERLVRSEHVRYNDVAVFLSIGETALVANSLAVISSFFAAEIRWFTPLSGYILSSISSSRMTSLSMRLESSAS